MAVAKPRWTQGFTLQRFHSGLVGQEAKRCAKQSSDSTQNFCVGLSGAQSRSIPWVRRGLVAAVRRASDGAVEVAAATVEDALPGSVIETSRRSGTCRLEHVALDSGGYVWTDFALCHQLFELRPILRRDILAPRRLDLLQYVANPAAAKQRQSFRWSPFCRANCRESISNSQPILRILCSPTGATRPTRTCAG